LFGEISQTGGKRSGKDKVERKINKEEPDRLKAAI